MSYSLIIAEKPSVAASIAKIVGAVNAHRDKANGYLEGNGYHITWAFGHLVGLDSPEQMGFEREQLPLFPEIWSTHPIETPKQDMNKTVKKQLDIIKKEFNGADKIIVATDAGREGELIFRYIYEYLECKTPFVRLWISSLTDEAIRNGLKNLIEGKDMKALSEAAHARSEADWLVGFNASRALRIATGYKGNLSLGRVQTPVLCMICDRFKANKTFVPTPYWVITALLKKMTEEFIVTTKNKYSNEQDAEADANSITSAGGVFRVTSITKKQVTTKPPLLYDLTSLQRTANTKYGLTAEETLKVAQSLYEKKYLSYPRTGSRYIPEDVFKTIPKLIGLIESYGRFANDAKNLNGKKLCRKSVDDTKITDHHALLPTNNIPESLTGNEKTIWEMVTGRMLEAFGEDSLSEHTDIDLECAGIPFQAKGNIITKPGWKSVFGEDSPDEKKPNEDEEPAGNGKIPHLTENEKLQGKDIKTVRKTDKPLPIYTDATLLGEMETCGKKIEDEELREAMKDVGLGTPATRAATIETLINRGYIVRQSKKLIPTERGENIADKVKGRKIADVKTTGEWEFKLSKIEKGILGRTDFEKEIKEYVLEIIEDLKKNCEKIELNAGINEPTRTCPICGKKMMNQKYSVTCPEENGGCGFKINREIAGKKLPTTAIDTLASGRETHIIKGFKAKSGRTFDCKLGINREEKKLTFLLEQKNPAQLEGLQCPCCGDTLQDDKWKMTSSCGFTLYKTQGGVQLDEKQIRTMLSGGKVLLKGMKSKAGKKFNAWLKINTTDKKIDYQFEKK